MDLNRLTPKAALLARSSMTPIERARGRFLRAPDHDAGTPPPAGGADDLLGTPPASDPPLGDPPASDPPAGDPPASDSGADPDWYANVSAEVDGDEPGLRDWVKSRGYKTLDDVVKSARDNQKALRDSGRVKVPGDDAGADEIAAYRKAIGVPDDPKGYKLPELTGADGEPVPFNDAKLQRIAENAHKAGIPAGALEAVLQAEAEADAQELSAAEAEIQRRAEAHAKKWGDQAAENTANINNAARALGLSRDELLAVRAAWGPERALDVFAKLGAGISEDTMIDGDRSRLKFGVSGAEAQKQLDEKSGNPEWAKKALVPGTPESAEYERLNAAIMADADRKQVAEA